MKFGSTLQFNAVPEWRDHYLDYEQLKKLIFRLERANVRPEEHDSDSLVDHAPSQVFKKAVEKEVKKVDSFYNEIEHEVFTKTSDLEAELTAYFGSPEYHDAPEFSRTLHANEHADSSAIVDEPEEPTEPGHEPNGEPNGELNGELNGEDDHGASDSSDDEAQPALRRRSTIHEELVQKKSLPFENVSLRREVKRMYVLLNELLSFSDLNREGVRKALKKFDKVHGTSLLTEYMPELGEKRVFSDSANHDIGSRLDRLVSEFAKLIGEPTSRAVDILSSLLREHVVYERNTVWRELIGLERQAQGVQSGATNQPSQAKRKRVGWRRVLEPGPLKLIGIFLVFSLVLAVQPLESRVQSRCLALVILGSLLWATEALPLFVTSLLIPIFVVLLQIPMKDGKQMPAQEASAFVFAKMWSPVITVLLGGFALAAALSKYNMAKALAQKILTKVGTHNPRRIILVLMFVAAFLCMWISNVAAPVLLFSVAQPLLRTVPPGDPFGKALIMGIALASNVGGMTSPIASPQNILALQNMSPEPSWMEWFWVSLPVSILSIFMIWVWLCMTFPITSEARESLMHIRAPGVSHSSHFGFVHAYILGVTILTIGLWCFSHELEPLVGDMGVLALIPLVLLFGPGILSAADFNNFLWTIVALAMGGIVLGQSVESCGLLTTVATYIQAKVAGLPVFAICVVFGLMVLVLASFISHTVAALIILPLVKSVGEQLDNPHPRLIVMVSALLCSGAMALPTSGFPNVTAVCMVDELGTPYLTVADFMSRGIPASLIVYVVVVTVGYLLCTTIGF